MDKKKQFSILLIQLYTSYLLWAAHLLSLPTKDMSKEKLGAKQGLPWWISGKEPIWRCRRHGFDPWTGKIPWRRKWQPTSVFLPGETHGQRNLVGYTPWGHKESETTERLTPSLSFQSWHSSECRVRSTCIRITQNLCLNSQIPVSWVFPHSSVGKESVCNARAPGLIPGLGRSPGEENGNRLQHSCLENPMDRGA